MEFLTGVEIVVLLLIYVMLGSIARSLHEIAKFVKTLEKRMP